MKNNKATSKDSLKTLDSLRAYGGDIFDLARAYLGATVKSFHHVMRHIEDRLNRLSKENPHD